MELLDEIIRIARSCCGEDVDWGPETSILADMALSSLEIFEFVFKVEARFAVRFSDRELGGIVTLGDLAEAVQRKAGAK